MSNTTTSKVGTHPNADTSVTFTGYAAYNKDEQLQPYSYNPPPLGDNFIEIQIRHSGICGSDLHTIDSGWGKTKYPVIVGHEIAGIVTAVGSNVKLHKVGDRVAVGAQCWSCMSSSCRGCSVGLEQLCTRGVWTYHSKYNHEGYKGIPTHGGYADRVRVHELFAFTIPDNLQTQEVASLMCAGTTVYSPLARFNIGSNSKVAVVGIGGLGHLCIMFANALGAEVTAVSTSDSKRDDAIKLGAKHFIISKDKNAMKQANASFDVVICTATVGPKDFNNLVKLVKVRSHFVMLGMPNGLSAQLNLMALSATECSFTGSSIGSRQIITDMLKLASDKNIKPWTQILPMRQVNDGIKLVRDNKVRYRVVLENDVAKSKI